MPSFAYIVAKKKKLIRVKGFSANGISGIFFVIQRKYCECSEFVKKKFIKSCLNKSLDINKMVKSLICKCF